MLQRALARHGNVCFYCGRKRPGTVDHVVPRSRGGSNRTPNLVPACRDCNSRKGNLILWLEWEPPEGEGRVWDVFVDVWPPDYPTR